jgi:hypothetical protein
VLRDKVDRVRRAIRRVYGARKVRSQLAREAIPAACRTVEWLMRADGPRGVLTAYRRYATHLKELLGNA